ncbi:hypothetical protein MKEN_00268000 [Mycena kentingensis (nom. inval.)]|nr:hypothetical protein MKEN_00268000 [Mycena kentingensis (nom. inval.)]
MDSEPRLPPELEREIFELAAQCLQSNLNLLLVARRVHEWVEPCLYRVVRVVKNSRPLSALLRAMSDNRSSLLVAGVRCVFFESPAAGTEALNQEILAQCPNVTRVALTPGFSGAAALAALEKLGHLEYLTANLGRLFPLDIDGTHPVLARVTHLSLLDNLHSDEKQEAILAALPAIPSLTHLRLDFLVAGQVRRIFETCPRLEILLLNNTATQAYSHRFPTARDEPRVVRIANFSTYSSFWTDWLRGAYGLADAWQLAEECVRSRLCGEGDAGNEKPGWIVQKWETWPTL